MELLKIIESEVSISQFTQLNQAGREIKKTDPGQIERHMHHTL